MSMLDLYRLAEAAKAGGRIPMMLFPIGTWKSARHPKLSLTRELADELIANFDGGVLGTEPVVDSSGRHDTSTEAAGWIKRLFVASTKDGGEALYADWEPTDLGASLLNEKRYAYNSVEIGDVVDNATGKKTHNVLRSATLTNTPMLRMLPPVLEAGESIATEPVSLALSELTAADDDPVAALIAKIDGLLADDTLKGKAGITAIRTMLREVRAKASAHTLSEPPVDAPAESFSDSASESGVAQPIPHKEKLNMSELTQLLQLSEDADEAQIATSLKLVLDENATLKAHAAEGEKAERVRRLDAAIASGQDGVLPAKRDALLALAESDPKTFDATMDALKGVKVIALGEVGSGETTEETEYADASAELAEKTAARMGKDGTTDYGAAMTLVLSEDEDLRERYVAFTTRKEA